MKTINESNGPLRQVFQDFDDFAKHREIALECAEKGDTVEIWQNGDYFTLEFHNLQADAEKKEAFDNFMGDDYQASLDKLTIRKPAA